MWWNEKNLYRTITSTKESESQFILKDNKSIEELLQVCADRIIKADISD